MTKRLRRQLAALTLGGCLMVSSAHGVSLTLNNKPLDVGETPVYQNTTYVSLRLLAEVLRPDAQVTWENGTATVRWESSTLSAVPGEEILCCDGETTDLSMPVLLEEGRTLVPVRPLSAIFGLEVEWDAETNEVRLTTKKASGRPASVSSGSAGSSRPSSRDTAPSQPVSAPSQPAAEEAAGYSQEDLYWLSRIISAESRGECREGKIAVGNVVLNRVAHPEFPDSIYEVIFDARWGGQFEPVRNGTVYNEPTQESVEAAIACLKGENTAGDSIYFLAPDLTSNHWTMENRTYVTTIGVHWFYE